MQDGNITKDIVAVVLVEKSEKVHAAKNKSLVEWCGNINMSLQSLVKEVSGYKCEYCSFVARNWKKLRNHQKGSHTVEGKHWNGFWHLWEKRTAGYIWMALWQFQLSLV